MTPYQWCSASRSEATGVVGRVLSLRECASQAAIGETTIEAAADAGNASDGEPKRASAFLDLTWMAREASPLAILVADLRDTLVANESRLRQRTAARAVAWNEALEAVICGVTRHELVRAASGLMSQTPLAIQLAKPRGAASRYSPFHADSGTLRDVIDALAEHGVLDLNVAKRRVPKSGIPSGEASKIVACPELLKEIAARGIGLSDCRPRRDSREVIILGSKTKEAIIREGVSVAPPRVISKRVEYQDTPTTRRYRNEVQALNAFLDEADLTLVDDGQGFVDTGERLLRRYFTQPLGQTRQRFDLGGRLFGAFWSNLERTRRRASLRIDGMPVAEVDMHAAFARLAYAQRRLPFPENSDTTPYDPYELPLCAGHRGGAKMALNAMLCAPGGLKALPFEIRAELPDGVTLRDLRAAFLERLPALEPYLTGKINTAVAIAGVASIGLQLMFTESQILLAALASLMAQGVVALPLHDALLVADMNAEIARRELEAASLKVCGVVIPCNVKRGSEASEV